MRLDGVVAMREDGQVSTDGVDLIYEAVADEVEVAVAVSRLQLRSARFHFVAYIKKNQATIFRCFPVGKTLKLFDNLKKLL